ncbi:hypothetical protein HYH03_015368 [Edaphochlamys debaryana]|uniref:Uncharacterized protein n=1 Tax=Edaphochlamys debaryana TaxID=47281 RepID=A0A835XLX8_9CHLO|nr:hypothetical protein HYH03_015368 [Edaphochlamys debaryana]|eukprot:KAG2485924.1 hypothetical protein HYH03_015368 [Edaphochlamys debaryana]
MPAPAPSSSAAGGALARLAAAAVLANSRQHTSWLQAAAPVPVEEASPARASLSRSPESPDPAPADPSQLWVPDLVERIAAFLSPHEVVGLRLVSKEAARLLRGRAALSLSQPVPPEVFAAHWSRLGACKGLTLAQRRQLITLTARSNVVANLEVAVAAAGLAPRHEDLEAAAGAGALESCRWLVGSGRLLWPPEEAWARLLRAAARGGHKRVCRWCLKSFLFLTQSGWTLAAVSGAVELAASAGHVRLAKKLGAESATALAARGLAPDDLWRRTAVQANGGCDLRTVRRLCRKVPWAPEGWPAQDKRDALVAALRSQTPDWWAKAEYWAGLGATLTPDEQRWALDSALYLPAADWQERVEFLMARGAVLFPPCCLAAAGAPIGAKEQRLAWLKAIGLGLGPYLPELIGTVIGAGDTGALAWLLAEVAVTRQRPYNLSDTAAKAGHLEVLQLLTAAKCVTLGARAMPALANAAASGGQLAVLQWAAAASSDALSSPVPFAAAASTAAARSGCEAAVELLAELGCPQPTNGEPYRAAAQAGDWRMLPLLRRAQVPLRAERILYNLAVAEGAPLATIQWLLPLPGSSGRQPNWHAVVVAARQRWSKTQDAARRKAAAGGKKARAEASEAEAEEPCEDARVLAWAREQWALEGVRQQEALAAAKKRQEKRRAQREESIRQQLLRAAERKAAREAAPPGAGSDSDSSDAEPPLPRWPPPDSDSSSESDMWPPKGKNRRWRYALEARPRLRLPMMRLNGTFRPYGVYWDWGS